MRSCCGWVSESSGMRRDGRQKEIRREREGAYTKASLTETTKTFPAEESLGWAIKPGMWESEQVGPVDVLVSNWSPSTWQ